VEDVDPLKGQLHKDEEGQKDQGEKGQKVKNYKMPNPLCVTNNDVEAVSRFTVISKTR